MKKFLSLFITLLMMFSLTACGNDTQSQNDVDDFLESVTSVLEDYEKSQETSIETTTSIENEASETSSEEVSSKTPEPTKSSTPSENILSSDFKNAMDSYEEFMDEYVSFMKKYADNPTDFSLLADYSDYMSKYADFIEDFEKWEDEDLNTAETAYYIEVQTRVNKKLLEVAQ